MGISGAGECSIELTALLLRFNKTVSISQTLLKRGGIKEDKENFVKLVKSLKMRLSKRNKMVTAAIGATSTYIRESYAPMKELCE